VTAVTANCHISQGGVATRAYLMTTYYKFARECVSVSENKNFKIIPRDSDGQISNQILR